MDKETLDYFDQMFESIRAEIAKQGVDFRQEVADARRTIRENTEAMLSYKSHIEKLLNAVRAAS